MSVDRGVVYDFRTCEFQLDSRQVGEIACRSLKVQRNQLAKTIERFLRSNREGDNHVSTATSTSELV
jgi:hypothetical protein